MQSRRRLIPEENVSESATTNVASRPGTVLELNDTELRNNRVFKGTGFSYKTAIDETDEAKDERTF